MFYDFLHTKHIYIVCGKTDLRKGIDGLASLIQQDYQLDFMKMPSSYFAEIGKTALSFSIGMVMVSFFVINESTMVD